MYVVRVRTFVKIIEKKLLWSLDLETLESVNTLSKVVYIELDHFCQKIFNSVQ